MNVDTMTPAERLALWDTPDRPERWNSGNEHHLADLIIRDLRGQAIPPADDVREALIRLIWGDADAIESLSVEEAADRIIASVRPHGTVTDAEVEAAARVLYEKDASIHGWPERFDEAHRSTRIRYYHVARAALDAARGAA